jgi:hypothetical protein
VRNGLGTAVDTELLKAVAPVLAALVAAVIAIWTWYRQRAADHRKEQEEQSTRYLTPFAFAAEDLQSRLYNIVRLNPEILLDGPQSYRAFATETLYLVAQYFYYEALVLQYTPFGRDPELIPRVQAIRKAFAGAASKEERDPWCLFHPRQRALGRAASEAGSTSESPSAASLTEFERFVRSVRSEELGIPAIIHSFDDKGVLPDSSKKRMARVQVRLVGLLEYLEPKLVESQYPRYRLIKRRAEAKHFTLFAGGQRRGRAAPDDETRPPPTDRREHV